MRTNLIIALMLLSTTVMAQQNVNWSKWTWLMSEWQGQGTGKPGQGTGTFSFKPDLNEKILVRKNHAEYIQDKKSSAHDDLMIIYPDQTGDPVKAIYFDSEGHTISYSISYPGNSIVLNSVKAEGAPNFRLTYSPLAHDSVNTKFEIMYDGNAYMTYAEGKSWKVK